MNSLSQILKHLLYILTVFCRHYEMFSPAGSRQFLGLALGHLSVGFQIGLVTSNRQYDPFGYVLLQFSNPFLSFGEAFYGGDVIADNRSHSLAVVDGCDGIVLFLTRSVLDYMRATQMVSLTRWSLSSCNFFSRQLALTVYFCLSSNSFRTYLMEMEVLPTRPYSGQNYLRPALRFCRLIQPSDLSAQNSDTNNNTIYFPIIYQTLNHHQFTTLFLCDKVQFQLYPLKSNKIYKFPTHNKINHMDQEFSFREQYLSSSPLDPQKQQEYPFSSLNDHILLQADHIKKQLKKRSAIKTGTYRINTPEKDQLQHNHSCTFEKHSLNHKTSETCTPTKLSIQKKNHTQKTHNHKKTLEKDLKLDRLQDYQHGKLLNKVTIHCLRMGKERIQNNIKSFQSQYNYILHKFQRLKKTKQSLEKRSKRLELISEDKRRNSLEVRQIIRSNLELDKKRALELKNSVISHRAHKEQSIEKAQQHKKSIADNLRKLQQRLQQEQNYLKNYQKHVNQTKFMKAKVQQLQRRNYYHKIAQKRKRQAKAKFRKRWLNEFQSSQKAKDEMLLKQQQYTEKINTVFQRIKSLE